MNLDPQERTLIKDIFNVRVVHESGYQYDNSLETLSQLFC